MSRKSTTKYDLLGVLWFGWIWSIPYLIIKLIKLFRKNPKTPQKHLTDTPYVIRIKNITNKTQSNVSVITSDSVGNSNLEYSIGYKGVLYEEFYRQIKTHPIHCLYMRVNCKTKFQRHRLNLYPSSTREISNEFLIKEDITEDFGLSIKTLSPDEEVEIRFYEKRPVNPIEFEQSTREPFRLNIKNPTPYTETAMLFGASKFLHLSNYGSHANIEITSDFAEYSEILTHSGYVPFQIDRMIISSNDHIISESIMKWNQEDINGQIMSMPLVFEMPPTEEKPDNQGMYRGYSCAGVIVNDLSYGMLNIPPDSSLTVIIYRASKQNMKP